MRRILHISDVHFGPPHLPRMAEAVLALVEERRPHLVALSGDLTQRAKPHQFRAARSWVARLGVPTVTVPGNHDVPLYRFWERFFDPYGAYRRHFAAELEPIYRDDELLAVGVNTAHGWTFTEGRIRPARLRALGELLAAAPAELFKLVIAHHHLIPPPNFGQQQVLTGARAAIERFSRVGVDLVLSGHHHQTYIGSSEEFYPRGAAPVVILHSGTTTSTRGRGGERDVNSCNWIVVDEESMVVSHLRWHDELEGFAEHSRHWYPRQRRRPYTLDGLSRPTGLSAPAESGRPPPAG
jgi:3',5'-cyclic AMP phosphodiesterase CpdA